MKIEQTKHGRGVFATKRYKTGDIIETSQMIVLNTEDTLRINETLLYDYYFAWGAKANQAALALGNGSLFNHSYKPNAKYIKFIEKNTIDFVAIKSIEIGDEILVNYNGDPSSKKPLWFPAEPNK